MATKFDFNGLNDRRAMGEKVCISEKTKAYAIFLKEELNLPVRKIAERCHISKSSVAYICKQGMESKPPPKRSGRPPALSARDRGRFLRKFKSMREENPNVKVGQVAMECELHQVSIRTLSRILRKSGFRYVRPMRKGILTAKDKKQRVAYALQAIKNTTPAFWTDDVLMYLDEVSFVHKRNPCADALAPAARVWRTPGEGLQLTAKGSKDVGGGNICHFIVGISFGAGAVVIEEYTKMNGEYFSDFIENTLHRVLLDRAAATGKEKLLFLQDNDPSQNSGKAKEALKNIGAEVVKIPPRSPDLNPIENFFHNVKRKLRQDAITNTIVCENLNSFRNRIIETIRTYDKNIINKTISSMHKRLYQITKNNCCRTKY